MTRKAIGLATITLHVKQFGANIMETGLLTAVPGLFGAVVMVLWTRHSDATGERKWHMAIPALAGAVALAASASIASPTASYIMLVVAGVMIYTGLPSFWPLPTALLTGPAAAGGIALINAVGNLIKGRKQAFGIRRRKLDTAPIARDPRLWTEGCVQAREECRDGARTVSLGRRFGFGGAVGGGPPNMALFRRSRRRSRRRW